MAINETTTLEMTTYMTTMSMTTDDEDFTMASSGDLPTTFPPDDLQLILRKVDNLAFAVDEIRRTQHSKADMLENKIEGLREGLDEVERKMVEVRDALNNSTASSGSGGKIGKRGNRGNAGGGDSNLDLMGVRTKWDDFEPMLISEGLFAIAKVMSFLRPICFTVMSRHVGPMQISLGGMMFDICKFLLIFSFVWFAFSLGMNQLYSSYSYDARILCDSQNDPIANCKQPFDT